jgi:hypothetical protein
VFCKLPKLITCQADIRYQSPNRRNRLCLPLPHSEAQPNPETHIRTIQADIRFHRTVSLHDSYVKSPADRQGINHGCWCSPYCWILRSCRLWVPYPQSIRRYCRWSCVFLCRYCSFHDYQASSYHTRCESTSIHESNKLIDSECLRIEPLYSS